VNAVGYGRVPRVPQAFNLASTAAHPRSKADLREAILRRNSDPRYRALRFPSPEHSNALGILSIKEQGSWAAKKHKAYYDATLTHYIHDPVQPLPTEFREGHANCGF
jgi:hypothetical protein